MTRVVEVSVPNLWPAGAAPRISLVSGESVSAGVFVNIYVDSGVVKIRPADSTDGTKPAHGYCTVAVSEGNPGSVLLSHGVILTNTAGLLTPGANQYLGADGFTTETAPVTAGHLRQYLGIAITETTMVYLPEKGTVV